MPTLRIIDDQESEPSQPLCNICQKQFSNYVCPRCNLKYCSLTCYKDMAHADCTESFYKESVTAEIESRHQDPESQQKMKEILRRFEAENEDAPSDEDDEEALDSFVQRFSNLDIEKADTQTIWDKLSPEERSEFESILARLDQPNKDDDPELWQHLLSDLTAYLPWWLRDAPLVKDTLNMAENKVSGSALPNLPTALPAFQNLCKAEANAHLMWNLLHILLTYCYLIRHLMGDMLDDVKGTVLLIKALSADVLFSTAKDCAFGCVRDVLDDVVGRIQNVELSDKQNSAATPDWYDKLKLMLLGDVSVLLGNVNSRFMVRAMSHLCEILHVATLSVKKVMRVERKSYFYLVYAMHITQAPSQLELFRSLVEMERKRVALDKQSLDAQNTAAHDAIQHTKRQQERIVELTSSKNVPIE